MWWWRSGPESDKTLVTDTLTTDDEGRFTVQVPMQMPDAGRNANIYAPRYYNFVVEADATDAAGESHHGETSLPLSDKATAFTISMPAKIEADSVARVTFSYQNNAGKPIPGDVIYKVTKEQDNKVTVEQAAKAVPANEPFEMRFNTLKSGRYTLEGVCGEDTVKHEFVVFSMKDKHPAVETHNWFYASAGEFPADGRPIYVQMVRRTRTSTSSTRSSPVTRCLRAASSTKAMLSPRASLRIRRNMATACSSPVHGCAKAVSTPTWQRCESHCPISV